MALPKGEHLLEIVHCTELGDAFCTEFVVRESHDVSLVGTRCTHCIPATGEGSKELRLFFVTAGVSDPEEADVLRALKEQSLKGKRVAVQVREHSTWWMSSYSPIPPHTLQDLFDNLTWHEVSIPWRDVYEAGEVVREGFNRQARAGIAVRFNDGEVVLIGDINELGGVCDDCMYDAPQNMLVVAWADIAEFGRPVEVQPTPKNVVRLVVEVDMDDDADWGVGVVPGSGDELPPPDIISTVLTFVAREHNEQFNQGDDDEEAE